jgi:hypothetical protein
LQTGELTGRGQGEGTALNSQRSNLQVGTRTKAGSIDDFHQQTFDPNKNPIEDDSKKEKAEDI